MEFWHPPCQNHHYFLDEDGYYVPVINDWNKEAIYHQPKRYAQPQARPLNSKLTNGATSSRAAGTRSQPNQVNQKWHRARFYPNSRYRNPVHFLRHYASAEFRPPVGYIAEHQRQQSRPNLFEHQRQQSRALYRPQAGETADGWRRVIYRGRRHPFPINQQFPKYQHLHPEKNRSAGNANRYQRLRFEDDILISTEPFESEPESDKSSDFDINQRNKKNQNSKARGSSRNRLDLCEGVTPEHGGGSRREKSMADAPSCSAPSTAAERPTSDNLYREETKRSGSIQALTWADVVKSNSDKKITSQK
ncbi:unnamed protein product [Cuscuta europaea]|uniref:Uncharacterized protein n=1 Tax=Cuscuta europaea TaxID=41803 RepID=A0A9P0YUH8_CUSEU|nr:unnamed protein product [Cuscuta europaea]